MAHLMKFHLLQSEVVKVKFLMNSNMTLTVLNLHQKTDLTDVTTKCKPSTPYGIQEIAQTRF